MDFRLLCWTHNVTFNILILTSSFFYKYLLACNLDGIYLFAIYIVYTTVSVCNLDGIYLFAVYIDCIYMFAVYTVYATDCCRFGNLVVTFNI